MDLYTRIREMLTDNIQNIFLTLQDELHIECGDCPPDLEWDISNATDDLTEAIETAIEFQMV